MNPFFSGSGYLLPQYDYPNFGRLGFLVELTLKIFKVVAKIIFICLIATVFVPVSVPALIFIFFMLAKEDRNAKKQKRT